MLWKSCSSSYTEHNKIGFEIFGFFYDFISNLQDTAKTLKRWRIILHADPCQLLKVHNCALGPFPPYPDGGGALAGGEVRLGEANKRARSAIGLTRD
jgi:hypothetical protein